jgi:hypothetical protein
LIILKMSEGAKMVIKENDDEYEVTTKKNV